MTRTALKTLLRLLAGLVFLVLSMLDKGGDHALTIALSFIAVATVINIILML